MSLMFTIHNYCQFQKGGMNVVVPCACTMHRVAQGTQRETYRTTHTEAVSNQRDTALTGNAYPGAPHLRMVAPDTSPQRFSESRRLCRQIHGSISRAANLEGELAGTSQEEEARGAAKSAAVRLRLGPEGQINSSTPALKTSTGVHQRGLNHSFRTADSKSYGCVVNPPLGEKRCM